MEKNIDLSGFDGGRVVVARQAGLPGNNLVLSETYDLLGASHIITSRVYRELSETGRKCVVDVRGQKRMPEYFELIRKQQSSLGYICSTQKCISE